MPASDLTDLLGDWEGYDIGTAQRFEAGQKGPTAQVWIELLPMPSTSMTCDGCGGSCTHVHDVEERWVRDLPLLDAQTYLLVHRRRVQCPRCGPKLERLPWLMAYARSTNRLVRIVALLCDQLPIKHVADFFGLKWDAVKAMHKTYLALTLGPPNLDGLELIVMDEFAIQKGHRYATVVLDYETRRVVWVSRNRDRESVRKFFELMGPERCRRIKAVAMDMTAAYAAEVTLHCPQAEIVYDLFHVAAKYSREVIDRVRVDEANRVGTQKKSRKLIKSARWLLLRNPGSISQPEDRVRLKELLAANRNLMKVYILKDDLKGLWKYKSAGHAMNAWKGWRQRAMSSGLEPLRAFTRKLGAYITGILSHCRYPIHTSVLEGVNNKIKVIKRMAYGFRDDEYFFMRIRAAFPGKAG